MVGLAYRAGRVLAGSAACEKGLKQKKICLLLVQQGLSEGSLKGFAELCRRGGAEMLVISPEHDLGRAIGRPNVMLAGITNAGFAKAIENNYHGGSGIE